MQRHVLTQRQIEVALLIAAGLSNKVIAYRLGITQGTVKMHVHMILERLQLKNRTQLAVAMQADEIQRKSNGQFVAMDENEGESPRT